MKYLIQGFFFQNGRFMFAGMIFPNPDDEAELIGTMIDHYGESKIFKVNITDTEIYFIKKYDNRDDLVEYYFKRNGNIWVGWYSAVSKKGKGAAKCIFTEAPDSLLLQI